MANKVITVTDPSVVTNDTLLGYNNYSNIDGQLGTTMTPTEATNGKTITLSDGVVHEVTTKPVGTTNGEFSAVVSNAVTVDLSGSVILLEDDFAGTDIDTLKWTVTNLNNTYILMTQDDQLEFNVLQTGGPSTAYESNVTSIDTYNNSAVKVIKFDLISDRQAVAGAITNGFGISGTPSTDAGIRFEIASSSATEMNARLHDGAAFDNFPFVIDVATLKSFKIVLDADCSWYYWSGSEWTLIRTVTGHGQSGDFHVTLGSREYGADEVGDYTYVDDVYVTDADFSTLNPI